MVSTKWKLIFFCSRFFFLCSVGDTVYVAYSGKNQTEHNQSATTIIERVIFTDNILGSELWCKKVSKGRFLGHWRSSCGKYTLRMNCIRPEYFGFLQIYCTHMMKDIHLTTLPAICTLKNQAKPNRNDSG